jgi:alanine-synthesizing transaminase
VGFPYSCPVAISFSTRLAWPARDNSLSTLRAEMLSRGQSFIEFSESNPTRVGLPAPELGSLVDPANLSYKPDPRGLIKAREALARDYSHRRSPELEARGAAARGIARGTELGPEQLFLCASTSEAYSWLFKLLCDPGDAILVPKPGYPLFDYLAGLDGVVVRPYRLEYFHPRGWQIDLDSLREGLELGRAKALVLINPNNPTGSYVGGEERRAILELCGHFGCALIADEVFFGFKVEGGAEEASFIGEAGALTFVLDGLSKRAGAPQLKLGWIAASGPGTELEAAQKRLEIIADAYLSAASPVMNALPAILDGSASFALSARERLAGNLASLRRILDTPGSPHRVLRCEGGWTAIVESPRLLSEEELALGLLREAGLYSHPGYYFDMEREAFFTAGLILPPEILERGARAYADYFAGIS